MFEYTPSFTIYLLFLHNGLGIVYIPPTPDLDPLPASNGDEGSSRLACLSSILVQPVFPAEKLCVSDGVHEHPDAGSVALGGSRGRAPTARAERRRPSHADQAVPAGRREKRRGVQSAGALRLHRDDPLAAGPASLPSHRRDGPGGPPSLPRSAVVGGRLPPSLTDGTARCLCSVRSEGLVSRRPVRYTRG